MSGFDWIIAAVFLVSILVGLMRGFVKESLSVVSWIVAIWLAFTFCTEAGEFLSQSIDIPNQKFRTWAGFALIFIVTLFVFAIISYVITKFFVRGPIKGTDRILGVGFGALRGVAIVVAALIVARGFGLESSDWWQNSKQLPRFEPLVNYVEDLFPEDWRSDAPEEASLEQKVIQQTLNSLPNSLPADADTKP